MDGKSSEMHILESDGIVFSKDDTGKLRMSLDGTDKGVVRPVQCYPITRAGRYVAIHDSDDKEIGIIQDISALDPESRDVISEELKFLYLITKVHGILNVTARYGLTTWLLKTDRGVKEVHMKDRGDIRFLPGERYIFTDGYGMKFEIEDASNLDDVSRAYLMAET